MSKRMRVFAFAVAAAGAMLLTACTPSPATGNEKGAPRPANTTSADTEPTDEDLQPVDCGPVETGEFGTHTLTALPSEAGLVGCTEAFNVIDEYLKIPSAERSANFEGTPLSDGWTCGTDDGETLSIGCVKGKNGDQWDFAFATKPADK